MAIHADVRDITTEMYLKQIFVQHAEERPVTLATLARSFAVSAPSALGIIRRMERDGLIERGSASEIVLSEKGKAQACCILRRHHLAERFLTDTLKLPWSAVHAEACRLEHAITEQVEQALDHMLGYPASCPHGNCIPPRSSCNEATSIRLARLAVGDQAVVCRVGELGEQEPGLLALLEHLQLVPGAALTVVRRLPTIDTLELELGGRRIIFGLTAANYVYCQQVSAE